MKYFLLLSLCLACSNCKKSNETAILQTSRDLATVTEKPLHPLANLVGYWEQKNDLNKNILFIQDNFETDIQDFKTYARGLDLYPDFGYRSLAFGQKDTLHLEINPDRNIIEALLEKTINGRKQLIETEFKLENQNNLTVTIKSKNKSVVQNFIRLKDWSDAKIRYLDIQKKRARVVLLDGLNSQDPNKCHKEWLGYVHARGGDLACVKSLVEGGAPITAEVLQYGIESSSMALMKYLISKDVNLNAIPSNKGNALRQAINANGGMKSFEIGEHGMVRANFDGDEIILLILKAGADRTMALDILAGSLFPQSTLYLVQNGEVLRPDNGQAVKESLYYFEERWGQYGPAILKAFLERTANPDYAGIISVATKHANVSALQILKAHGATFSDWNKVNLKPEVENELKFYKSQLKPKASYFQQLETQSEIERLSKNLEYIEREF